MPKTKEELEHAIRSRITGGAHVAVDCRDIDKSIHFYTEVLGFEVTQDIPISEKLRLVFLTQENLVVELIHRTQGAPVQKDSQGKILHICLLAEEEAMPEMLEHFRQLGVPIHEGLRYNPKVKGVHRQGSYCFFIHGPDGELIEFNS